METTAGTLLGGRIRYRQPAQGYRTGIEPVILAAAIPARAGDSVLEAGLGAGAGLLCLRARVPGVLGTGIEQDPATADVARQNLADNGCPDWPVLTLDVTGPGTTGVAGWGRFHHAYANPPWHDPSGTPPPDARRRLARHLPALGLEGWAGALVSAVRSGGSVTLILPGSTALRGASALRDARCGGLTLMPLWPKAGRDARLVLVQGRRGSRAPDQVMPGLVLHRSDGGYTEEAEAVLTGGQGLALVRGRGA